MNKTITKRFSGTPFTIGCSQIENRPGTWNSTKVSIYRGEDLIGEYIRNYSAHGPETFYPFKQDGQWFALYSAQYTALRVMKLHELSIEDWCGDIETANGFCPVEVYVPKYNTICYNMNIGGVDSEAEYVVVDNSCKDELEFITETKDSGYKGTTYCQFAFISGCVWGDDTSWKIRYIDLRKIFEKELLITEKFGYWEMPSHLKLKECVDMDIWEPDHQWIRLTKAENINLDTGETC